MTTQPIAMHPVAIQRAHLFILTFIVLALFSAYAPVTSAASGAALPYEYNGEAFKGYYASKTLDAPLVLLLHDWDGLNEYEMRRADMIADLGYAVLAADMFGADTRPITTEDKQRHTGALLADRQKMRGVILAALDAAKKAGANTDNTVVAGYCLGGGAALEMARSGADIKGYVSFHGVLATPEGQDYSNVKGEILVLHGSADSAIPMTDFATLANQMEAAGVAHEMVSYGGAPHAFTVFDIDNYDANADRKSWQRFIDFLAEKLGQTTLN